MKERKGEVWENKKAKKATKVLQSLQNTALKTMNKTSLKWEFKVSNLILKKR